MTRPLRHACQGHLRICPLSQLSFCGIGSAVRHCMQFRSTAIDCELKAVLAIMQNATGQTHFARLIKGQMPHIHLYSTLYSPWYADNSEDQTHHTRSFLIGLAHGVVGGHIFDPTLADTKEGTPPGSLPSRPYISTGVRRVTSSILRLLCGGGGRSHRRALVEESGWLRLMNVCPITCRMGPVWLTCPVAVATVAWKTVPRSLPLASVCPSDATPSTSRRLGKSAQDGPNVALLPAD